MRNIKRKKRGPVGDRALAGLLARALIRWPRMGTVRIRTGHYFPSRSSIGMESRRRQGPGCHLRRRPREDRTYGDDDGKHAHWPGRHYLRLSTANSSSLTSLKKKKNSSLASRRSTPAIQSQRVIPGYGHRLLGYCGRGLRNKEILLQPVQFVELNGKPSGSLGMYVSLGFLLANVSIESFFKALILASVAGALSTPIYTVTQGHQWNCDFFCQNSPRFITHKEQVNHWGSYWSLLNLIRMEVGVSVVFVSV